MHSPRENLLIASLSPKNRQYLLSRCTSVRIPLESLLFQPGEPPKFAYFMISGVASLVIEDLNGHTSEVGLIGAEGMVGAFHILGPASVPNRCFVQLEATALRIPLAELRSVFQSSSEIRARILEFVQEQSFNLAQIAGCHRFHPAEERLACWLLMAQDRSKTEVLNLTQEFLAMMLGSQRTTVTATAGMLQRAGFIEYRRGHVRIVDRQGLEDTACECYEVIRQLHQNLYKAPVPESDDYGDSASS